MSWSYRVVVKGSKPTRRTTRSLIHFASTFCASLNSFFAAPISLAHSLTFFPPKRKIPAAAAINTISAGPKSNQLNVLRYN